MKGYGQYHVEVNLASERYIAGSYMQSGSKLRRISKILVGGADIQSRVFIHTFSFKTGKILGTNVSLSREAMDELAIKWLRARGHTIDIKGVVE